MSSEWLSEGRSIDRGRVAEQIHKDLRDRILKGELARGTKLPTERELAQHYGVSGATVREAIRALSTMHMIEVRHGSGAYVTADAEQLIAQSLRSIIQLERLAIPEILGVLTVLNAYAAEMAATRATAEDNTELLAALDLVDHSQQPDEVEAGLRRFLFGLANASHSPLLVVLCKFLAGLQIQMARDIAGGSAKTWRQTTSLLADERRQVVAAIARRDAQAARITTLHYHQRAAEIVAGLAKPAAKG